MILICGSPHKDGNSNYILEKLFELKNKDKPVIYNSILEPEKAFSAMIEGIEKNEQIVFSFPLYADSAPAYFMKFLNDARPEILKIKSRSKVYILVNNGFFESSQNSISVRVIKSWCGKCGIIFGGSLAVGGGGMLKAMPIDEGPWKKTSKFLIEFFDCIQNEEFAGENYIAPSVPRFLYKFMANIGMKMGGKKNGLTNSQIKQNEIE